MHLHSALVAHVDLQTARPCLVRRTLKAGLLSLIPATTLHIGEAAAVAVPLVSVETPVYTVVVLVGLRVSVVDSSTMVLVVVVVRVAPLLIVVLVVFGVVVVVELVDVTTTGGGVTMQEQAELSCALRNGKTAGMETTARLCFRKLCVRVVVAGTVIVEYLSLCWLWQIWSST